MGCGRDHEVTGHGERSERSDHGVDYDSVGSGYGDRVILLHPLPLAGPSAFGPASAYGHTSYSSTCFYEFVNWRGRYMGLYVIIGVRRPLLDYAGL